MKNDIAVVIVNWNKKQDTIQLLGQLDRVPESVDIFVVDNASTDNSVVSIRNLFPEVEVIVNRQNLGGTGGFNTGLRHVLECDRYAYVWLLDNDASVRNDSLSELLGVMSTDPGIGLAGSRIIDIENEEITVETGGKLHRDFIGVAPLNRNSRGNPTEIFEVDYVAICSALVRISALKTAGLMDDRLFLFWDDMDWGLYFNECGYKVVCVSKSIVYHGSFTERARGKPTNYYYNTRNSFLVYSKHTDFFERCAIFYRSIRSVCRKYIFYAFHTMTDEARLVRIAVFDYMMNNWGQLKLRAAKAPDVNHTRKPKHHLSPDTAVSNILVSTLGANLEESRNMLKKARSIFPRGNITVLTNVDRKAYFEAYESMTLSGENANKVGYMLSKLIEIKRKKFDAAVAIHPHLYLYSTGKIIYLSEHGDCLLQHRTGVIKICALGLALVVAEIVSHMIFPMLICRSIQYKRHHNRPEPFK